MTGSDKIKIEVNKIELNLLLFLLTEKINSGDDVVKIRHYLELHDKIGDILLKENSLNE